MRTQPTDSPSQIVPWLEYFNDQKGRAVKYDLVQFPFTIGRDPAVDLPVDSTRVSRQHAEIMRTKDGRIRLRDLNSTNGTSINGQPVTEKELCDGDVIVLADSELTFFSGSATDQVGATQIMPARSTGEHSAAHDYIAEIRRLHEGLVLMATESHFQPIVDLTTKALFGYEAVRVRHDPTTSQRSAFDQIMQVECQLLDRINQQHRLIAVDCASRLPTPVRLVLPLQVTDVSCSTLPNELGQLGMGSGRHQLLVKIPEAAVCDIPYFREFTDRMHAQSVATVYGGFCGSVTQLESWQHLPPDYIELAPALVHGISRASGGWRKMQDLVDSAHTLGCEIIANGIQDDADAECLVELGCNHALGPRFGAPAPVSAWLAEATGAALA